MRRILGFDGIRGLAVISVVLTHLQVWQYCDDLNPRFRAITPMFHGLTGVQAFFILSGFLITTLLTKEYRSTGAISLKNFYIRRTLRIFPLYLLFMACATVLHFMDYRVASTNSLLHGFAYAYNFVSQREYAPFMGHLWSLAVEEHFYILWPAIFMLFALKQIRGLSLILVTAIIASLVIHLVVVVNSIGANYYVSRWTFVAGYGIAAGCLLALGLNSKSSQGRFRALLQSHLVLGIAIPIFILPVMIFGRSWLFDNVISGYFRCLGLTIFVGWIFVNQESKLAALLEFRPLKYIGVISYGIYMFQGLFLATGPYRAAGAVWPPSQSIGIWLLLVAAPLSYRYFERPIIEFRVRLQDRSRQQPAFGIE